MKRQSLNALSGLNGGKKSSRYDSEIQIYAPGMAIILCRCLLK